MRTLRIIVAVLILAGAADGLLADDGAPGAPAEFAYPAGESTQQIEGLGVTLYVPHKLTPESGSSLLVLLHGAGAKGANLATFFRYWPRENYVVCAPQATGRIWTSADLGRVKRIVKVLQDALPIDQDRLHVAGFSNGASNLHVLAFDPDLRPRSGTWVGGAFGGGAIPVWARARFGALFMVGEQDRAQRAVRQSAQGLRGRVKHVELHVEPDIGHTWPSSQLGYHLWWMGVMEGRFSPGKDENFDWDDDLDEAIAIAREGERRGVLLYVFDPDADRTSAAARALQTEVFLDPDIRRLGRQLEPVMLERGDPSLARHDLTVERTPTVVLFGPDGAPAERFSGRVGVETLRAALGRLLAGPPPR